MKLVLGSRSPRRKELLSLLGYSFDVRVKDTDESFPESLPVQQVAAYIAEKKAMDLLAEMNDDEVLICADTIVVIGEKILGKPKDREEAIRMIAELSGRDHLVITGVTVWSNEKKLTFSVETIVTMYPLSGEEIDYYVDTFKPYDKAGAYGIQEWIGAAGIRSIQGSYNNVVGLPTHEVYTALRNFDLSI